MEPEPEPEPELEPTAVGDERAARASITAALMLAAGLQPEACNPSNAPTYSSAAATPLDSTRSRFSLGRLPLTA